MSDWWIPRSVEELERAVNEERVGETHHLDLKDFSERGIPPSVGRTVASLAVDGGVLVLGVAEDKTNRRFELRPRSLAGMPDALDQVVANTVSPNLRVTINALARETGDGYLVVLVPASPRAPHMFDGRYYGRNETTSRQLADAEVRALWARHADRRERLIDLLATEVEREPAPVATRRNARLFVVAQPVSADPRLLLDSFEERDLYTWVNGLERTDLCLRPRSYSPTLGSTHQTSRRAHGAARSSLVESDRTVEVTESSWGNPLSSTVDLEVREDGGLRLYYGRASDEHRDHQVNYLLLAAIAGEVAGVIEAARMVSSQAQFRGSWSFGVALRGVRGIAAYAPDRPFAPLPFEGGWKFSEDSYDEVAEVDSFTLFEPGSPVLEALVGRLVRATRGPQHDLASLDPFGIARTASSPTPQ